MATLSEIVNADAAYHGDQQLGGYGGTPFEVSKETSDAFKQLAQYTFLYHKSQYDQRQKDADEKIKQLAGLTGYDLVNGIDKDKSELIDAQSKLIERRAEEARLGPPSSPKEKMEREVQFQSDIQQQIKKIEGANARKIKLDAYTAQVQKLDNISAQEKELRIKQAQQLFNNTDIYTLPEIPNHDLSMPKNGDPVIDKVAVIKTGKDGNSVIDETISQFSIGNTWKNAYLHSNNVFAPTPPPQDATPQQKNEYEQKKLAYDNSSLGGWGTATNFYNQAIQDPNYKKTATTTDINILGAPAVTSLTNEIDTDKIKADNPIIGGILSIAERYNKYAEKRLADVKNGYYIDDVTGEKVTFTGGDKAEDIKFIDVTKPLKPEDISFLEMFSRAKPDEVDKKFIPTDNSIQKDQMANQLKIKQIDEAGANYRARLPYIMQKLGTGTATKDEKSVYPVLKTQELVETIGINQPPVKFTDLTPEQQSKIKEQSTGKITDFSTVNIENGKIKVTGTFTDETKAGTKATDVSLTIIPDDITKSYYDEVNKNDAGKEAPERKYFKFDTKPKEIKDGTPEYYGEEKNMKSRKGNTITYKDGTVWIYDEKTGTLNPKK